MESTITKINQKSDSRKKLKPKEPPLYKVIMHNDNITTMDFVVSILQMIYDKNYDEAVEIMLKIHNTGNAVVGVYTLDIAVSKINKTHQLARAKGFPLKCTYEKA
ncbi:MAG: ATP-dependent Clp protease adaptor ClpS [Exilispira sp.]